MLRPTSFDVAERAGVSQSTVSRALRNSPGVNAETRARVSAAARELGYVVDRHASSLRLKSSETIALVTICRPGEDRSAINPFYFALLGSIAAATSARGFNLLVSFQENADNFRADFVASGLAEPLAAQLPLDPFVSMGLMTLACAVMGWLAGPSLGGQVFYLLNGRVKPKMKEKEAEFFARVRKHRVDPANSGAGNPGTSLYYSSHHSPSLLPLSSLPLLLPRY